MKQRIHFVDVAKGMLILMVIATHIDGITSNSGLDTKKNKVITMIKLTHTVNFGK